MMEDIDSKANKLLDSVSNMLGDSLLKSSLQKRAGFEPFDPAKHKPQDLGLGGLSTEYLMTEFDSKGEVTTFPSVWFDKAGVAHLLSRSEAQRTAAEYEKNTDQRFPRFDSIFEAVTKAMHRSAGGGATKESLAKDPLGRSKKK